jgi:hypothetical protein
VSELRGFEPLTSAVQAPVWVTAPPLPGANTAESVAFQQSSENRRIGRVTANDAMRTELEHIANPGDRSGSIWLERPLLQPPRRRHRE